MRGKTVIIKAFGGDLLVRKVWSVGQNVIYVTDEKNYTLLTNNKDAATPIGVPKDDVFEYHKNIHRRSRVGQLKLWKEQK
jgi:hypothetical protein